MVPRHNPHPRLGPASHRPPLSPAHGGDSGQTARPSEPMAPGHCRPHFLIFCLRGNPQDFFRQLYRSWYYLEFRL